MSIAGTFPDLGLVFAPQLYHFVGNYDLLLVGTLDSYGISAARPFGVTVTDCVATLSISNINLPFLENTWYSAKKTYSIAGISADIVQQPACNYGYVYNAYYVPQGETDLFALPQNEISFSNNEFGIKKCNPLGVNTSDP